MASIIDMPKLSDTMTVGTLVNWLKNEGDKIEVGDLIAEVETDKATMELESFEDGILLKHYVQPGAEVLIGAPIAAVGAEGEEAPAIDTAATPKAEDSKKESEKGEEAPVTPKAEDSRKEVKDERAQKSAKPKASASVALAASSVDGGDRVKASPLAKRMAGEYGVSLAGLEGSGPQGRIVKADILAAMEGKPAGAVAGSMVMASAGILEDKSIPVSNMRRTIARHLIESKTQIPHFYLNTEVDAAPLMDLRAALNEKLGELSPEQGGIKFTVNDFILKATAEALQRVPVVNSSWKGDSIEQYGSVHLSFGVAVDDGLVTPVIRDAQAKSLREISAEAKELVKKARSKKLKPEEMTGSTFTVTNLGMFGVSGFFGIINPPNAAILSVGATIKKPVVDKNDNIVVGYRMQIGFSGDHRVVDGAAGAQFLEALKSVLETPALMFV